MKNFLPFPAIFCRSLPLLLAREIGKEETFSLDILEVHNFINRKKNPSQTLSNPELVNLLAWNEYKTSIGGHRNCNC